MAIGDFTKVENAEIIGGDYSGAEFGVVAISNRNFACAIKNRNHTIILDDVEVEYFAPLKTKGISTGASNAIEATVHGVLSVAIPGGGVIGNAAAAAAGVASRGAVTKAAGGARNYRDVLVVFRDGKKTLVRCANAYIKTMKKYCLKRKLSKSEVDLIIGGNGLSSNTKQSRNSGKKQDLKCRICHEPISISDKFCSHCGARIQGEKVKKRVVRDARDIRTGDIKKHKRIHVPRLLLIFGVVAALILIAVLVIINIYYPSDQVVSRRFKEVLDTCIDNEFSGDCKAITEKYKISFRYCHAYFDIPEIDKDIPVYAVAMRDDFKALSLVMPGVAYDIEHGWGDVSPYYACAANQSDLGENITAISDEEIDKLQASYLLKDRPWVSFNPGSCTITHDLDSILWNNIPNYKDIIYEAKNEIYNRVSYCVGKDNPRLVELFSLTDNKLRKYSENKIVREYYYKFDYWNINSDSSLLGRGSCIYTNLNDPSDEKEYRGKCLKEVGEEDNPLSEFVDFMKERRSSKYHMSRLIK